MSWLTNALAQIEREASTTYLADKARGLRRAAEILSMAYIEEAESNKPIFANYANPEDMK